MELGGTGEEGQIHQETLKKASRMLGGTRREPGQTHEALRVEAGTPEGEGAIGGARAAGGRWAAMSQVRGADRPLFPEEALSPGMGRPQGRGRPIQDQQDPVPHPQVTY